jgi:hypothetical protein
LWIWNGKNTRTEIGLPALMDFETFKSVLGLLAGMGTTMFSIFLGFLIFILSSGHRLSNLSLFLLATGVVDSVLLAGISVLGLLLSSSDSFTPAFAYGGGFLFLAALIIVFTIASLAVKQILEESSWP